MVEEKYYLHKKAQKLVPNLLSLLEKGENMTFA